LLAGAMGLTFSLTLGLLFAARASGHFSIQTLQLPGVVPVALIGGMVASLLMFPFTIWAVRTGTKNLRTYAPMLWIALATYVLAVPGTGAYVLWGLALLATIGSVVLGFIPATNPRAL
jgi:hypothetical protein